MIETSKTNTNCDRSEQFRILSSVEGCGTVAIGCKGNRYKTILLILTAAACLVCGIRAAAQPSIGPEIDIGKYIGPSQLAQESAAAAAGGSGYLVVWQDRRSGADYDVYGILVGEDGTPQGESFLISSVNVASGHDVVGAPGNQTAPAVAFNGTDFLVVWLDSRTTGEPPHIYGARVTISGQLLDRDGIAISTGSTTHNAPAAASDGADWLVAYEQESTSGIHIYGAIVTAAGTAQTPLPLAFQSGNARLPALAWNASKYLLVWQDYRGGELAGTDIYGCLVTSAGQKSGVDKLISSGADSLGASGDQTAPAAAAGPGGTCLVVWQDTRNIEKDIYGARVSGTMSVYDTGGIMIETSSGDQEAPDVAWNGDSFIVVWRDRATGRGVHAGMVDASGQRLGETVEVWSGPAGLPGPGVAVGGSTCLIVWHTLSITDPNVLGAAIDSASSVGGVKVLSVSVQNQKDIAVAFDGVHYVAVWSDRRSGTDTIYAARIAVDGTMLDPEGVRLSYPVRSQTQPAIAWGGTEYLVVWTEGVDTGSDIKGLRIGRDLKPLDFAPLDICSADFGQNSPAVASNGSTYLVTWVDSRNAVAPDYFTDLFGALVTPGGVVTPLTSVVSLYTGNQFAPAIASDGADFLVVWEDYRSYTPETYCARISGSGSVLDSLGVKVSSVSASKVSPKVAFDGTNYLIVWSDRRDGSADIYGVRMSPQAARIDASDIAICSVAGYEETSPSVAWAGSSYYVVWQDTRSYATSSTDIYFVRIGPDGSKVDASEFVLSESARPQRHPAAASAGSDSAIILYGNLMYSLDRLAGRICGEREVIPTDTVGEAKSKPNGTELAVMAVVVTAGTDQLGGSFFYIEDRSRSSGIKVVSTQTVQEGDVVDIDGIIETAAGERQITASSVSITSTADVPEPVGLTCRDLGGGALNEYTPGITGGIGLNNVGLLVRIWGRIA
ncbi:MAG: hypothetical protein HYX78_15760, partial [Armatimonadetes bacterium]|nr:hypothetical protein [Armatimonadota bacterium]